MKPTPEQIAAITKSLRELQTSATAFVAGAAQHGGPETRSYMEIAKNQEGVVDIEKIPAALDAMRKDLEGCHEAYKVALAKRDAVPAVPPPVVAATEEPTADELAALTAGAAALSKAAAELTASTVAAVAQVAAPVALSPSAPAVRDIEKSLTDEAAELALNIKGLAKDEIEEAVEDARFDKARKKHALVGGDDDEDDD